MNIRAVAFDLDYTLIDASDAIYLCIKYSLETLGQPVPTREVAVATIGLALKDAYKRLTNDNSDVNAKRFQDIFVKYAQDEKQQYLDNTRLFDTALPVLQYLRANGCKIALVTSKTRDCVDNILNKFNLNEYFDFIIGGNEIEHPKPHPMSIEIALRELNIPASETIYVGDSIVDAEAANRAGVTFIAVLTGQTKRDAFQNYLCHSVLDDLSSLPTELDTYYFSAIANEKVRVVIPMQADRAVAHVASALQTHFKCGVDAGFMLAIESVDLSSSPQKLAFFLLQLLEQLDQLDPAKHESLQSITHVKNWNYKFDQTDLMISTYASCYPANHLSHCHLPGMVFIVFQQKDPKLKSKLVFFNSSEDASETDAVHYVKPLAANDEPIVWWEREANLTSSLQH